LIAVEGERLTLRNARIGKRVDGNDILDFLSHSPVRVDRLPDEVV
jgi:hypothetical protein